MAILSRHNKRSDLQKQILREIGKGVQAKSDISKNLEKLYPDVSDATKILVEIGLIKQKTPDKRKKPYILTEKGIKELINMGLSLEDFWRLVFFIFDEDTKHELENFTVDSIFSLYEKDYYRFSKDLGTPLFDAIIDLINHLKKRPHLFDDTMKILKMVATAKTSSVNYILKKFRVKKSNRSRFYNSDEENPGWLNIMTSLLLIEEVSTKKIIKFKLTHLGLLFLFDHLYDRFIDRSAETEEDKKIVRIIINNHKNMFPTIFKNWFHFRKVLDDKELLSCFKFLINFENFQLSGDRMQNGGLYEFFNSLKSMRMVYLQKLKYELEDGQKIWKEWLSKNKDSKEASMMTDVFLAYDDPKTRKKLYRLKGIIAILRKIVELTVEETSYDLKRAEKMDLSSHMLRQAYQIQAERKSLENLITLQFFTILQHMIRIRLNMLLFIELNAKDVPPTIREDIANIREVWKQFSSTNMDFMESYKQWISEITTFEKENVNLINNLDKFSIDSSVITERQDIDFLQKLVSNSVNYQLFDSSE